MKGLCGNGGVMCVVAIMFLMLSHVDCLHSIKIVTNKTSAANATKIVDDAVSLDENNDCALRFCITRVRFCDSDQGLIDCYCCELDPNRPFTHCWTKRSECLQCICVWDMPRPSNLKGLCGNSGGLVCAVAILFLMLAHAYFCHSIKVVTNKTSVANVTKIVDDNVSLDENNDCALRFCTTRVRFCRLGQEIIDCYCCELDPSGPSTDCWSKRSECLADCPHCNN